MAGFEQIVPAAVSAVSSIAKTTQGNSADAQGRAAERNNQMAAAQQARHEAEQRNLLERQQASARAAMAASGLSGDGGSADAILEGMAQNAAESINAGGQMAQFKINRNLLNSGGGSSGLADGALGLFKGVSGKAGGNLLEGGASNAMNVFQSFYGD